MNIINRFPLIQEDFIDFCSWTMPTWSNNNSYGTLTNSQSSSNAWYCFAGKTYNAGKNNTSLVTWTWNCPDTLLITSVDYVSYTVSDTAYSTKNLTWYTYDYSIGDYVQTGYKATTGKSDYTKGYGVFIDPIISDKFKFAVQFAGGANLGSYLQGINIHAYKVDSCTCANLWEDVATLKNDNFLCYKNQNHTKILKKG